MGTTPWINVNGSSVEALIILHTSAAKDVDTAREGHAVTRPHPRDYLTNEAHLVAVEEWRMAAAALATVWNFHNGRVEWLRRFRKNGGA
jgi:hypothetical protein